MDAVRLRAEHGMNGMRSEVRMRSRCDSSIRVETMAGTLQPNAVISGTEAFPWRPTAWQGRSMRKAMRGK